MASSATPADKTQSRPSYLGDLLTSVFERRGLVFGGGATADIGDLSAALMASQGESTVLEVSQAIFDTYAGMDEAARAGFFMLLAKDYDIDPEAVALAARRYGDTAATEDLAALIAAAEPKRLGLFRKLNQVQGATERLVHMRADLLPAIRQEPLFGRLDLDLQHLFASWFNRGFLVLRRINWQSPATVLEKIIAYEAVHAINDWDDLRRRVEPADRRCFAYFHPCMPEDPLIFVEVALTKGTPNSIASVLAEDRAVLPSRDVDTAVFYSISNCQRGLAGISFGNALIKQVVADLAAEIPGLSTFVTLSPVPGFTRWLQADGRGDLLDLDREALQESDDEIRGLAALYLATAKSASGQPADPVARFHLANGARLEAVHPRADLSENGLRQSCGAMVNYLYNPKHVADRAKAFDETGEIAASRKIENLVRSKLRQI